MYTQETNEGKTLTRAVFFPHVFFPEHVRENESGIFFTPAFILAI